MAYYRNVGVTPRTRHTLFRSASGDLYYEELMGEEGFSFDSALLYHRHIPSALVGAREWVLPDQGTIANAPLIPRHFRLHDLFLSDTESVDAVRGRRMLLANQDVRVSYVVATKDSPYYRNATGDECVYVESGEAILETVFGELSVSTGDFVVIPRATTHRWVVPKAPVRLYAIEASSHIVPPRRYLSSAGQFLEHAPYCERDLRGPEAPLIAQDAETEVYVKHRGDASGGLAGTIHVLPHHPFDVVGWDGCLYPYAFNVKDFMPITGKVHQPPPVHQVFEGRNFVVCAFVPRKVDYHERAVPVPYYHSNVDSDEVMFYVGGDYEARQGSGIGVGSISFHPGGHAHGPQPGAIEATLGKTYFDELGIMVDTFAPLRLGEAAQACDDGVYASSWSGGRWDAR